MIPLLIFNKNLPLPHYTLPVSIDATSSHIPHADQGGACDFLFKHCACGRCYRQKKCILQSNRKPGETLLDGGEYSAEFSLALTTSPSTPLQRIFDDTRYTVKYITESEKHLHKRCPPELTNHVYNGVSRNKDDELWQRWWKGVHPNIEDIYIFKVMKIYWNLDIRKTDVDIFLNRDFWPGPSFWAQWH